MEKREIERLLEISNELSRMNEEINIISDKYKELGCDIVPDFIRALELAADSIEMAESNIYDALI